MPETAKRTARVPILGEDGRISDDYVPAAIGEGVEAAEAAAKRAETAATDAKGSATAAGTSATKAQESAAAAGNAKTAADTAQKGAESAKTEAEAAKEAAEAAKTGAESARDSAQTAASQAQQSATAAAESAASVADKFIASAQATTLEPGSQATASVENQVLTLGIPRGDKGDKGDQGDKGDPGDVSAVQTAEGSDLSVSTDEGTVTIDDSSLRERISELENQAANVVTGTSTGLVAHGEDAYAQKPIEVRLKGKTWVNRWPVINGTSNGITVSTDETGLVTVTGTATADADVTADVSGWAAGKSYTTMVSAAPTGCSAYFEVQKPSGNTSINATTTGATLNVASDATNCVAGVHVTSGTTVNASFRVMLVDGTEAPDCFTPPASITSAKPENLVTGGKNLADIDDIVDRTIENFYYDNGHPSCPMLLPGTYTISADIESTIEPFGLDILTGDAEPVLSIISGTDVHHNGRVSITFTLGARYTQYKKLFFRFCRYESPQTYTYSAKNIQLELGSTATAYEPPTVTQTLLPEVELRSLPDGTCDELVIKADGTCEVERKTGYIASYTDEEVAGEYVSTGNGLEAGASIVYELDEPTTEPQSPVTLPALPAPTFNQYHDSAVPSDTSTEYVRDINIVLDNLAKQVAGTASAVAVREASTIEEE